MYVLHILCTYVRSYGFMDGIIYLHIRILYILRMILVYGLTG